MDQRINHRTEQLLSAPPIALILRLAAPNVIAMVVAAALSVNEAYLASRAGVESLAGLGVVFPFVMFMQALSIGAFGGASTSAIGRMLGASDQGGAAATAGAAVGTAAAAAVIFSCVMVPYGSAIYRFMGVGEGVASAAHEYGAVFFGGCMFIWVFHALLAILRGTGDMRTAAAASLCVSVLAAILSLMLCLGFGPVSSLGMHGIALGYVLAHAAGALVIGAHIGSGRCGLSVHDAFSHVRWPHCGAILKVGMPAALNSAITVAVISIGLAVVGSFGEEALAAYGLGTRLEYLLVPIVSGLGAAILAIVATCIGRGNHPRAETVAWTGVAIAALCVGVLSLTVTIFPNLWLGLFIQDLTTRVSEVGRTYLTTVGPAYVCFAVGFTLFFACQGAARMTWALSASALRLAIVAVLLLANLYTNLTLDGVFKFMAAAMIAYGAASLCSLRWFGLVQPIRGTALRARH